MDLPGLFGQFNWVDWIIAVSTLFFLVEGWHAGFVELSSGLLSYFAAIWITGKYHFVIGNFFTSHLGISPVWADPAGYVIGFLTAQLLITEIFTLVFHKLFRKFAATRWDNIFGAVIGAINTLLIATFIIFILLLSPVSAKLKLDIKSSVVSNLLLRGLDIYGRDFKNTLTELSQQAVKFVTVKPSSHTVIPLEIAPKPGDLVVDRSGERQMLELVNDERIKIGTVPLTADDKLAEIAREYSRKMLSERYFSHYDNSGNDLTYRLKNAQIFYQQAGENLAYAPSVGEAHTGLMKSEEHRKNILDPDFSHIGIGIIDAGIYGKMVTQIFIKYPALFKPFR